MSFEPLNRPSDEETENNCVTDCDSIATERNRYFTGKYMAKRDFADEQEYFLSRHRLHNRILHGWGVVCGLRVTRHKREECRDRWVYLGSGIALDCCGRELIREKDKAVELPLPRWDKKTGRRLPADGDEFDRPFLVCLEYTEEPIEYVPALYAEGECDPARKEANRIRECARLVYVLKDEVEAGCWRGDDEADCGCRDDCDDSPDGTDGRGGGCIDASCPCGSRVPIALVTPSENGPGFELETEGRRTLPVPPDNLTHIVDINWPHGGAVTVSELRDKMGGQLKISFDRKLQPQSEGWEDENIDEGASEEGTKREAAAEREWRYRGPENGIGINVHTFVVQYGNIQRSLQFLRSSDDPSVSEDGCSAVYPIDDDFLGVGRRGDDLAENVVHVTLKCDFVLDCLGNPVVGTHKGGRLPTNSESPGGDFCSWFVVVADGYNKRPRYKEVSE